MHLFLIFSAICYDVFSLLHTNCYDKNNTRKMFDKKHMGQYSIMKSKLAQTTFIFYLLDEYTLTHYSPCADEMTHVKNIIVIMNL